MFQSPMGEDGGGAHSVGPQSCTRSPPLLPEYLIKNNFHDSHGTTKLRDDKLRDNYISVYCM